MSGPTLNIQAHGANNLKDVESLGKQDPYIQLSVDYSNPKSFQHGPTHKGAGKNPVWNHSFSVPLAGEPELFIEIMDQEVTVDAVIAFASIPINQIVHAPGAVVNGLFDVYLPDGKPGGEVHLTLSAVNVPGQNTQPAHASAQPIRGVSHINEGHQKRVKSLKTKETMADVGQAVAGGLLAVGAGLLANKLMGDHKKKEQEEAARKAEELEKQSHSSGLGVGAGIAAGVAATAAAGGLAYHTMSSNTTTSHESSSMTSTTSHGVTTGHGVSTSHQESTSSHYDSRDKKDKKEKKEKKHKKDRRGSGSDSSSSSDSDSDDDHKKKGDKKKWKSHGHYSAGDKVKFDGRKYVCLQGHNSQSDWSPSAAHSLWREE